MVCLCHPVLGTETLIKQLFQCSGQHTFQFTTHRFFVPVTDKGGVKVLTHKRSCSPNLLMGIQVERPFQKPRQVHRSTRGLGLSATKAMVVSAEYSVFSVSLGLTVYSQRRKAA